MTEDQKEKTPRKNKKRLNQSDVPAYSLVHAMRVPVAAKSMGSDSIDLSP